MVRAHTRRGPSPAVRPPRSTVRRRAVPTASVARMRRTEAPLPRTTSRYCDMCNHIATTAAPPNRGPRRRTTYHSPLTAGPPTTGHRTEAPRTTDHCTGATGTTGYGHRPLHRRPPYHRPAATDCRQRPLDRRQRPLDRRGWPLAPRFGPRYRRRLPRATGNCMKYCDRWRVVLGRGFAGVVTTRFYRQNLRTYTDPSLPQDGVAADPCTSDPSSIVPR
jgi:hypothetical protein